MGFFYCYCIETNFGNQLERQDTMALVTVIGTQWGDEGKGKIVDLLAENADCIVRFQGGNNAGHTLVIGDKVYKLNLLPSGIVRDDTVSYIGSGVVVDPVALMNEIANVTKDGLSVTPDKLVISESCHLILSLHKILDGAMEEARGSQSLGTTRKGIGPAYEDKVARRGIRMADLKEPDTLKERLTAMINHHNATLKGFGLAEINIDDIFNELLKTAEFLLPFIGSVGPALEKADKAGKHILFEGAQGSLLDIDHGTYPFVTSSNTAAGQTAAGSGYGAARHAHIIGLAKAYTTRVGTGPFPTEQSNDIGEYLGMTGHEFGTVTGRKRRCGWFDAPAVKHACLVSDVDSIALTKLDVLDGVENIQICTGYKLDGQLIDNVPALPSEWERLEPVYETMAGWMEKTAGCRDFASLPAKCQAYVKRLEEVTGKPISIISTSPERNDTILRIDFFKNKNLAA